MFLSFRDGPADGPPDLQVTADLPPQVCVRLRVDGVRTPKALGFGPWALGIAVSDSSLKPKAHELLRIQLHDQLLLNGQIDLFAGGHRNDAARDRRGVERKPARNT